MAKLVMGIGYSHSPEMAVESKYWSELTIKSSLAMGMKYVEGDGTQLTREELIEKVGDPFAEKATQAYWDESRKVIEEGTAKLKARMKEKEVDLLIVFGDDQYELLDHSQHPCIMIYYGDEYRMANIEDRLAQGPTGVGDRKLSRETLDQMIAGIHCQKGNHYQNHPGAAKHLITQLISKDFDVSTSREMPEDENRGIGHAFGVAIGQFALDLGIPVVPIYLNTYFPPNQPSPNRCYDLGQAVRAAIESFPEALNIAVLASGGLSHFVLDEERVDRPFIELLYSKNEQPLRNYPAEILQSGNSEMLNWIAVHAACQHLDPQWHMYTPVYRTGWGQGVGVTMMEWS